MSNKMITLALETKAGDPLKKLILLKLADNANDDGVCFPSYETIARHCEVSKRTIIRQIKEMVANGLLIKRPRMTKSGQTSNYFVLTLGSSVEKSRGDTVVTGGVTEVSLGGCHSCHPEPSLEPSIEPKELMSSQQADTTFDFDSVKQAYNEFANTNGLATIRAVTDKKKREVRSAYKVYCKIRKATGKEPVSGNEFVAGYLAIVQSLMTDFHTGQNKNNWKAGFDYFFATDIVENVLNENKLSRK